MGRLLAGLQIKMGSVAKEMPGSKRRAQWNLEMVRAAEDVGGLVRLEGADEAHTWTCVVGVFRRRNGRGFDNRPAPNLMWFVRAFFNQSVRNLCDSFFGGAGGSGTQRTSRQRGPAAEAVCQLPVNDAGLSSGGGLWRAPAAKTGEVFQVTRLPLSTLWGQIPLTPRP